MEDERLLVGAPGHGTVEQLHERLPGQLPEPWVEGGATDDGGHVRMPVT